MKSLLFVFVSLIAYNFIIALPVDKKLAGEHLPPNANQKVEEEIDNLGLEYGRYLQEVVMALEQDKHFSEKLQNVSSDDIKSGKIAGELDFVHHNVRTKLDELKRIELERLRSLIRQENELNEKEHVDHNSQHQFTKEDLHKLIIKASNDLEELDKKRREEFKQYEMEKEFQYQESLKNMTADQKVEAVKKHDEQTKKHKDHPRVHHPGSKQQFQEVWSEHDGMPKEEFDPKTFFALHDLNGDGVLDQEEVESLLSTEIKKLYDPNNPEDDPNEMQEEYHRMREHIYKEADKDHDGLISRKEFIDLTSKPEFEKDEGWKTIDEQQVYTQDELKEYEKHRQEALAHQYAYYVPQYYQPQMANQFVPYDHVAIPHPQQPGGVAYVPVQPQHPGAAQMQHPGAAQMQHPGVAQMQHPGVAQMQHPGVAQMQHPGIDQMQHPGVAQMQHPGVAGQPQLQQAQHYAQAGSPGLAAQPQLQQQQQYAQQPQIASGQQQPIYTAHVGQQQQQAAGNAQMPASQQQHPNQPPPVGYQQQQAPQYASNVQQQNNQAPQYSSGQASNVQQQQQQQQPNVQYQQANQHIQPNH